MRSLVLLCTYLSTHYTRYLLNFWLSKQALCFYPSGETPLHMHPKGRFLLLVFHHAIFLKSNLLPCKFGKE